MDPYLPGEYPDNVVDITTQRREAVHAHTPWEGDDGTHPLDRKTATAIAHICHEVRPSWSLIELLTALEACKDMNPGIVAIGAVSAALDRRVQHPSRIPHSGAHWPASAEEPVAHLQSVSEIARTRDTSTWVSHSPGFMASRCRAYLTACRDKDLPTDPLDLAKFKAAGVDVEAVRAEVYRT